MRHQQQMTAERIERLNMEIARRLSQFGSWAISNLFVKSGSAKYDFREGVTETTIVEVIKALADIPRRQGQLDTPYIQEMFPEFKARNLISLYAELSLINRKAIEESCSAKHCGIEDSAAQTPMVTGATESDAARDLLVKRSQYREAIVALLAPSYLIRYDNHPDHDVFVGSFEGIFLTRDTRKSELPSTDCLETRANGCHPSL
jgi:hypothetical protein